MSNWKPTGIWKKQTNEKKQDPKKHKIDKTKISNRKTDQERNGDSEGNIKKFL